MSTTNWFGLVGALLAVLIPFIINWFDKKSKLQQAVYFIELIKAQKQLKAIKAEQKEKDSSLILRDKLESLLLDIDKEINKSSEKYPLTYFVSFIVFEALLFLSAFFFHISDSMTKLLKGQSYETGMYFLEGIFKPQEMRIFLMAIFISISVYLTVHLAGKVFAVVKNNLAANSILLLLFNILFVIITVAGGLALLVLDPIVPLW